MIPEFIFDWILFLFKKKKIIIALLILLQGSLATYKGKAKKKSKDITKTTLLFLKMI